MDYWNKTCTGQNGIIINETKQYNVEALGIFGITYTTDGNGAPQNLFLGLDGGFNTALFLGGSLNVKIGGQYVLKNNKKRISSSFTFIYKSVVPFMIGLLNVFLLLSVLLNFPDKYWDLYIILVPFCLIVSLIAIYPLLKLREVFLDEENGIIIREKARFVNVPLADILKINRFMFYFFRIAYFDKDRAEKKILVMLKIREFLPTYGFGEIRSFKLLKDNIRQKTTKAFKSGGAPARI